MAQVEDDGHIWSWCDLSGAGHSSLSVGDVLSNLIHSLCEGIHAVRGPSAHPLSMCVSRISNGCSFAWKWP